MKKAIILCLLCIAWAGVAMADNVLTVGDVKVSKGGTTTLAVGCSLDTLCKGFQLDISLNKGLEFVTDSDGNPVGEIGFEGTDFTVWSHEVTTTCARFVVLSPTGATLPKSGTLLKVKVKDGGTLSMGNSVNCTVEDVEFATAELKDIRPVNVRFKASIANDKLTVDNYELRQNGDTTLTIGCNLETPCVAYQFDLHLGKGLELKTDDEGTPVAVNVAGTDHTVAGKMIGGDYRFVVTSKTNAQLPKSGPLLTVTVKDKGTLAQGAIVDCQVSDIELTSSDLKAVIPDTVHFTVEIPGPKLAVSDIIVEGSLHENDTVSVSTTLTNSGKVSYSGNLYLFASTTSDKGEAVASKAATVAANGNMASINFNWIPAAAGTYTLWICDDAAGNNVLATKTVEIVVPTAINDVPADDGQAATVYNTMGMKIGTLTKEQMRNLPSGVYIVGGKKVIRR